MDRKEYLLSVLVALNDGTPNKKINEDFYYKANKNFTMPKKIEEPFPINNGNDVERINTDNYDNRVIGFGTKTLENYGKNAVVIEGGWKDEKNIQLVQKNEISERNAYLNEMTAFFGDEINDITEGEFTIFIEENA